jgi:GNAT superfamily N-acetyltransferase
MRSDSERDIFIREGKERDILNLRKLAAATAYFGDPGSHFFSDSELLADLIINYYLYYEIEHLWVAELDNEIIGYVCGHFNQRSYMRCIVFKILPRALTKALLRAKIFSLKSLKLLYYNLRHLIALQEIPAKDVQKYSVHIHQNIRKGFRGRGVGSKLLDRFLSAVDKDKLGMQFKALRETDRFKFFERYGFKRYYYRRAYVWERWLGKSPLYYIGYIREPRI